MTKSLTDDGRSEATDYGEEGTLNKIQAKMSQHLSNQPSDVEMEHEPPLLRLSSTSREFVAQLANVDPGDTLERLIRIPIYTWNYIDEDPTLRHMGPMAQDFYAAFGIGKDDKTIYHIDAIGVCMAAIQGLHAFVEQQATQIASQQEEINRQATRIERLEAWLRQIQEMKKE